MIHAANYGVYGARKVHATLRRAGRDVARCTVERLMRAAGLRGVSRAKGPRTTRPAPETGKPADLVKRAFIAQAPNHLWVADITYIRTFSGWVYAAFRHRRLLPDGRRLAGGHKPLHRPRPRRSGHGRLRATA